MYPKYFAPLMLVVSITLTSCFRATLNVETNTNLPQIGGGNLVNNGLSNLSKKDTIYVYNGNADTSIKLKPNLAGTSSDPNRAYYLGTLEYHLYSEKKFNNGNGFVEIRTPNGYLDRMTYTGYNFNQNIHTDPNNSDPSDFDYLLTVKEDYNGYITYHSYVPNNQKYPEFEKRTFIANLHNTLTSSPQRFCESSNIVTNVGGTTQSATTPLTAIIQNCSSTGDGLYTCSSGSFTRQDNPEVILSKNAKSVFSQPSSEGYEYKECNISNLGYLEEESPYKQAGPLKFMMGGKNIDVADIPDQSYPGYHS